MRNSFKTGDRNQNSRNDIRHGISNAKNDSEKKGEKVGDWYFLDLFSTSQTLSSETKEDPLTCALPICIKNAPFFAYHKHDRHYGVVQGCCNDWTCPRCGVLRAKQEYGRIVQGCRELSEHHDLWFITITCRGREMSRGQADNSYGQWTNTLLTRWRTYCTRKGQAWHYAQVTERQKRGLPHSHILTSWQPPDVAMGTIRKWSQDISGHKVWENKQVLRSEYVRNSCVDVGLGEQYDISRVASVEAASRYVAKYLFKDTIFTTVWPKGWKRVRYSQSFPKLPERETNAFVLMTREDWNKLHYLAESISTDSDRTKEVVYNAIGWDGITIK